MSNDARLLAALKSYAATMVTDYDLTEVLHELTDQASEVLGITGAGIVLAANDGRLAYCTASSAAIASLEQAQEDAQVGPCIDAHRGGPVVVDDLEHCTGWADFREAARRVDVNAVVGLPLRLGSERLGALDLYDAAPRAWSDRDLEVAQVLGHVAAGYLIHEKLQDSQRLAGQLQAALDSRVVIEQAKGLIAADRQVSIDEAFEVLRASSRVRNTTLRAVAQAVVDEGFRPSRP